MDKDKARGIKRPRGLEKEKSKQKQKQKQKQKVKLAHPPTKALYDHDPTDPSLLPDTAKAESAPIIQAMKCMSNDEQSRFEAYRRCSFPNSVMTKCVALSLAKIIQRRSKMAPASKAESFSLPDIVLDAIAKPKENHDWNQILQCLVNPKSSNEIVIIVSTLAKLYAQRVVHAACQVAERENKSTSSGGGVNLRPHHLREARNMQLSTSVFFLGPQEQSPFVRNDSAVMVDKCKQKADAALAAQETYDEYHSTSENGE
mmetsp:Transcript_10767/g.16001  ORF Transcript_10767/g.16001 Transcript_10767/m.16001 type:complete len:258 (-) Transcript_10767:51-824(-)